MQKGTWYRYFISPAVDPQHRSSLTVTLIAAALLGSLEEYAQTYLAGKSLVSTRDEARPEARGKGYRFRSADGATEYSLLLLQDQARAYGLYGQGPPAAFEAQKDTLARMEKSFTLEHPSHYPEQKNEAFAYSIRIPPSWRRERAFGSGNTYLAQFTSPALGADREQTVHASLTLTVEPVVDDPSLDAFYNAVRKKLGDSFLVLDHAAWKDGYADLMRTETPMAESRVKRFYRAAGGRGYSLAFESREDVHHRVSRWCDMIAGTLKVGPEVKAAP